MFYISAFFIFAYYFSLGLCQEDSKMIILELVSLSGVMLCIMIWVLFMIAAMFTLELIITAAAIASRLWPAIIALIAFLWLFGALWY